jgi:hypothetical protein
MRGPLDPRLQSFRWGSSDQTACKPGSVPPRCTGTRRPFLWTGHCWPVLATYPDDSGRRGPAGGEPPARRPYSVLLQAGLAVPSLSPGPRWALTPPFHPYPPPKRRAVCFLWRYPWGRPRRALPAAFSPWSPDFPPSRREPRERPPGRLIQAGRWSLACSTSTGLRIGGQAGIEDLIPEPLAPEGVVAQHAFSDKTVTLEHGAGAVVAGRDHGLYPAQA